MQAIPLLSSGRIGTKTPAPLDGRWVFISSKRYVSADAAAVDQQKSQSADSEEDVGRGLGDNFHISGVKEGRVFAASQILDCVMLTVAFCCFST